jgi:MFS family permease
VAEISLLRQRNFGLLWFGGLISFIGDWIMQIALPVYIYNITGSVLATGATWMAGMLPAIVLGTLAGVYVDRWDRRVTMVAANLAMVPPALALLLVQTPEQVWLVYAVVLVKSTLGCFMGPAENALLPKLVDEAHLPAANALNTLNNNLARLAGPAIGGAVLAYFGFRYAVLLDAASFAIAGAMIALIHAPRSVTRAMIDETERSDAAKRSAPNVLREWLEGLRLVRGNRLISALFLFSGIERVAVGVFVVMIVPFAKDVLGGGAQELGWMMSAQAVGGLAGGVLAAWVISRFRPVNLVGAGLVLLGLIDLAIFNIPVLPVILLLFVLAGLPVIVVGTSVQTLLQTGADDRFRGRVFGAFGTMLSLAMLLGQIVASLAGGAIGPVPLMSAGAMLLAALGLVALATMGRLAGQAPAAAISGLEVSAASSPKASAASSPKASVASSPKASVASSPKATEG